MSAAASRAVFSEAPQGRWLFGKGQDLAVFGGSALASLALLGFGALTGALRGDLPVWAFFVCVVGVDVAHVWATGFRVYFDGEEVRRRPLLYLGTPLACYLAALTAYALGSAMFWRALAYLAVFHFVRQQVGWIALYGRRERKTREGPPRRDSRLWSERIDRAVIYAVTVHPIIVWHTRLPEPFAWFVQGDFVPGLADDVASVSAPLMWLAIAVFALKEAHAWAHGRLVPGKLLIAATTFVCWYGGIVVLRSDFAFTVTNVLIHGIPYLYLGYRYARHGAHKTSMAYRIGSRGLAVVALTCLALALAEEAAWDIWIWHDHGDIWGSSLEISAETQLWLVPILALPQLTHYVLDAFVWRVRGDNPVLDRELEVA